MLFSLSRAMSRKLHHNAWNTSIKLTTACFEKATRQLSATLETELSFCFEMISVWNIRYYFSSSVGLWFVAPGRCRYVEIVHWGLRAHGLLFLLIESSVVCLYRARYEILAEYTIQGVINKQVPFINVVHTYWLYYDDILYIWLVAVYHHNIQCVAAERPYAR